MNVHLRQAILCKFLRDVSNAKSLIAKVHRIGGEGDADGRTKMQKNQTILTKNSLLGRNNLSALCPFRSV